MTPKGQLRNPTLPFDRPIMIVGACRSGKTLVKRILNSLPEIAGGHEPFMIWNTGMSDFTDDARTAAEATPELVRRIRTRLQKYVEKLGGTRYVDDLAHHAIRLPFSIKVLPEARIIYVLRHGRDNVARMYEYWTSADSVSGILQRRLSSSRRHNLRLASLPRSALRWIRNYCRNRMGFPKASCGPTVPGQREFARTHSVLETVAYQWATMVRMAEDALADFPSHRVLRVRYETLLADPTTEAAGIAEFCELGDPRPMMAAAADIVEPEFDSQAPPLTDQQWETILPIMKPMLQRQDYC